MAGWTNIASPPIPGDLDWNAFVGMDRYAYIMGGVTGGDVYRLEVYRYDSQTKAWSYGSNSPTGSYVQAAFVINSRIYCLGHVEPYSLGRTINVNVYDPASNSWVESYSTTSPLGMRMNQNNFASIGTKIYYTNTTASITASLEDVVVYDISTRQWSRIPNAPYVRTRFSVTAASGELYILGGDRDSGTSGTNWSDVNRVDAMGQTTLIWREPSQMLRGKFSFLSAVADGEIYAIAGQVNVGGSGGNRGVSDVQVYNPGLDSWRYAIDAPFDGRAFRVTSFSSGIIVYFSNSRFYLYDTRTASISNPSPTSGFVNEKNTNTFSWTLESNPAGTAQQSATFQWRISGASTVHSVSVGSAQSVTIPANTFPDGAFEWRVSATNTAGIVAPYTDWFLISTIDERPNKPTGLYPNSGSRDGTKTIQFSWLHNSPLSTPQSAFEVQISYDGGYSWRALSNKVTTAVTQFAAAANTLLPTDQTGRVGWRVRTYNSDNLESPWSDTAFFIVHPAPQTPNWISVETGRARPLCRWTSLGQVGFQLQVTSGDTVIFDSGEIPGTAIEYRLPTFLPNGTFTFRLRIKNIRSLLSAWASRSVSINARRSLNITLQGEAVKSGANLIFDVEVRAGG